MAAVKTRLRTLWTGALAAVGGGARQRAAGGRRRASGGRSPPTSCAPPRRRRAWPERRCSTAISGACRTSTRRARRTATSGSATPRPRTSSSACSGWCACSAASAPRSTAPARWAGTASSECGDTARRRRRAGRGSSRRRRPTTGRSSPESNGSWPSTRRECRRTRSTSTPIDLVLLPRALFFFAYQAVEGLADCLGGGVEIDPLLALPGAGAGADAGLGATASNGWAVDAAAHHRPRHHRALRSTRRDRAADLLGVPGSRRHAPLLRIHDGRGCCGRRTRATCRGR